MTKDPEVILARIEEQRKQLGLSRADVALQTGMKYQTYASLFRRGKLPKFNELRNICNSLGLSIDDLIGDNPLDQKSKTNIFYWINKYNGGELSPTSILSRLPDKEGVARMFMDLSAAQNEHVRFSDEVFTLICKLLFMDETDFLFVYINHIRPRLRRIDLTDKGYFHSLKVYTSLSEIYSFEYNRFFLRENPIRRFKAADAYLWDKIYESVEDKGVNKQDFFAKTGISPALYSIYKPFDEFAWKKKNEELFKIRNRKKAWEYTDEEWNTLMAKQRKHDEKRKKQFDSKRPSPYTETIINIFEYLGITGIEDCIRSGYKTTLSIEDYQPSEVVDSTHYKEDDGQGVSFNVYVYNVQPEIIIDYSTGANWADTDSGNEKTADISAADDSDAENGEDQEPKEQTYILNKNTKNFHKPECSSVDDIKAENKSGFTGTREELIEDGFDIDAVHVR